MDCSRGSYVSLGHCVATHGAALGQASPSCSALPHSPAPYRARTRIGDASLVFYPAVVESLLVCKGATEGSSHGSHGVDADSRAAEDTAVGGAWVCQCPGCSMGTRHMHSHVPQPTLSTASPRVVHGTQESLWHGQICLEDLWLCRCQSWWFGSWAGEPAAGKAAKWLVALPLLAGCWSCPFPLPGLPGGQHCTGEGLGGWIAPCKG